MFYINPLYFCQMKKIVIGFLAIGIFCSCEKSADPDLEAPVMELEFPLFGQIINHADSSFTVRGNISDRSGLSEAVIFIHGGFDGHGHGRQTHVAWMKSEIVILDGVKDYAFNETLNMPPNILGGPYHYEMFAVDIHGNSTSHAVGNSIAHQIIIHRDDQPEILVTDTHMENGMLYIDGMIMPRGRAITFVGVTLSETDDEHLGYLVEEELFGRHYFGQTKYVTNAAGVIVSGMPLTIENDGSINLSNLMPQGIDTGNKENMLLKINVEDEIGSVSLFQARL